MKKITFLLVFLSVLTGLESQTPSPGGVSSPVLWFKTVPANGDLQGQYIWKDFGGDSVRLRLYDSRGATYGNEYFTARNQIRTYNFHPALDLSELNASKQFLLPKSNLSQATIISVWGPDYADFNQDMFLYALNGRAGEGYIFTKDKVIHSNESGKGIFDYGKEEGKDLLYQSTDEEANVNKFRERALKVATYNRVLQPNTSVWGERNEAVISIGEIFHPAYSFNTSTFNAGALNNRAFYGYTPEFIIYSRLLTPVERLKAESYLAVKYGLTLEKSYISSSNSLLWDVDANNGFNNRVTGYGRDDASGLYQKTATTSYEEAPYYSDDYNDLYDSFDGDNSYNLPSRYRLLVMGRQPANPLPDGGYVLFGDNNAGITAQSEAGINGIKLMPRRWLLNTNIAPTGEQAKHFEWNIQNLDVYTDGFKTKATKAGSTNAGSLVTSTPLLEKDGYFSWIISSTRRGYLTVKFGTNNPQITNGVHDYGYYISEGGLVYKIIRGVRQSTAIATVYANQKIEVGKEGNTVYLRSNGTRTYATEITIDAADSQKVFYGSILMERYNNDEIVLSDIRHGGFCDTGNAVELSYIIERAYEFRNYRTDGKTYLVIDRTGSGDFSSENVEYIAANELDETRYKIIFNNIFWDTDGNGRDIFTFGFRQSNLVAVATQTDPTCINDSLLDNGSISVKIKQGFKGFSYNLKNTQTQEILNGTFYSDSVKIENLSAGTYDLTFSELGGFNLYPKQAGGYANQAIGSTYFNSTANAYIEWTVSTGTQASAGMSANAALQSSPNSQIIGYGLHVNNGNLYQINNGAVSPTPIASVSQGDRIRVERITNRISYKLNGQEIAATDMRTEDRARYNYPIANVTSGGIYNLTWNRMATTATWVVTDNMAMEKSAGDSFMQTITLNANCSPQLPPHSSNSAGNNSLSVYYKNINNMRDVTARLELQQPEPVSLMVFDSNGRYILSADIPKSAVIVETDIHLPAPGVYIIKAFTGEGEYSAKAVSK
ncbi:hypothetical protein FACS189429_1670 [Bacteroidia bacterium]|nr:hypothetical protein FACS189429_1670 [Bacteroidia bacterium]